MEGAFRHCWGGLDEFLAVQQLEVQTSFFSVVLTTVLELNPIQMGPASSHFRHCFSIRIQSLIFELVY
jgi:hypothetical protein